MLLLRFLGLSALLLSSVIQLSAQYSCASRISMSSLPFERNNVVTNDGIDLSSTCATTSFTKSYALSYTPSQDIALEIYSENPGGGLGMGIQVWQNCDATSPSCKGISENNLDFISLDIALEKNQDYTIILTTPVSASLSIQIIEKTIVGVAINREVATQTLDVNGNLRIGMSNDVPLAGTVRWNDATKTFEGYDGEKWLNLSSSSKVSNNVSIGNNGISYDGYYSLGRNVASNDEYLAVCSERDLFVFEHDQGKWIITDTVDFSSAGAISDFGASLTVFGNRIVIGAPGSCKVLILKKESSGWEIEKILDPSGNAGCSIRFGAALALSEDYLAVGAPRDFVDGIESGSVHIYRKDFLFDWVPHEIISNGDAMLGDNFGASVDMKENELVVGAIFADVSGFNAAGKVYAFQLNGSAWVEDQIMSTSIPSENGRFGNSIVLFEDRCFISALREDVTSFEDAGRLHIYKKVLGQWNLECTIEAENPISFGFFGESFDVSEDFLVVGSKATSFLGVQSIGQCFLYSNLNSTWNYETTIVPGDGHENLEFGRRLSVTSKGTLVVGAMNYDGEGDFFKEGRVYFYDLE